MEVQFFSWVVLMDIRTVTRQLVYGVLNTINSTINGLFSHAYRVTKTPSQEQPIVVEVVRRGHISHVEGLNLAVTRGNVLSLVVHVRCTTSADENQAVHVIWDEQRPRGMIRVGHARHQRPRTRGNAGVLRVVIPLEQRL